jgi:hypothetical protein
MYLILLVRASPNFEPFTLLPFYPRSRIACLFRPPSAPSSTRNACSLHPFTFTLTRTAAALTAVRIKQPLLNRASHRRFPVIRPHTAPANACLHSKRSARRSRPYQDPLFATFFGPDLLSTTSPFPTNPCISSTRVFPPSRAPLLYSTPRSIIQPPSAACS